MKKFRNIFTAILVLAFYACEYEDEKSEQDVAKRLIEHVKLKHGSEKIEKSDIRFDFREHKYKYIIEGNEAVKYRIKENDSGEVTTDMWKGENLIRDINGETIELSDSLENLFKSSINSVFYFTFLPLNLSDPAVVPKIIDTVTIKNKSYIQVQVTFQEEGGGEDFEDVYMYWFHEEDHTLDYLAYQYFTNEGGIRFREAIDRQVVNDITFQNYINYKPKDDDVDINTIHEDFNNDDLQEVSRIENKNIEVTNQL